MSISGFFDNFLKPKPSQHKPRISEPIDMKEITHVSYDPITKTFHGLPSAWEEQVRSLFA